MLGRLALVGVSTARDVARDAFRRHATRVAVLDRKRRVTYEELGNRSLRMATAWARMGVRRGMIVVARLPDGVSQIEARLAAAECGAVFCLVPQWLTLDSVLETMQQLQPALFLHDGKAAALSVALRRDFPEMPQLLMDDGVLDWWATVPARHSLAPVRSRDLLMIRLAAGTRRTSNALAFTHGASVSAMRTALRTRQMGLSWHQPDVTLVGMPLSGLGLATLLPTLMTGGTLVLAPAQNAVRAVKCMARFGVTSWLTTPTLLTDVLDSSELDRHDISALRSITYGGESMPVTKLVEAYQRFGAVLEQVYEIPEVTSPVSTLPRDQHGNGLRPTEEEVLLSSGWAAPKVSLRVVDERGREVPRGKPGEVLVRSPGMFARRWRHAHLIEGHFLGDHLRTGDVGALSLDGKLTLLGRREDVLRTAEGVVFPRWVEECVHQHPAVKAAVYVQGPNARVMTFSLRRGWRLQRSQEYWTTVLTEHVERRMPKWQQPEAWLLFDELPRGPDGMVSRSAISATVARTMSRPEGAVLQSVPQ